MTQDQAVAQTQIQLFSLQDQGFRDFQCKLIPTLPRNLIIGIRAPVMRKFAKEFGSSDLAPLFLEALPHRYFEENCLHLLLIGQMKDFDSCLEALEKFLPYIDNWATCDLPCPGCLSKHKEELLPHVYNWLLSEKPFVARYGIGVLMRLFLDEDFDPQFLQRVSVIRSQEYYLNMMIAWYFATALAKQWEATLPYLTSRTLDPWTHNKTIQKALESYRLDAQQKELLRTLRIKST